MTKILICGSDGFMGHNISNHFLKQPNYEVFGTTYLGKEVPLDLDIVKNHLSSVDLTDQRHVGLLFESIKPDIVIQAAANTSGAKDITTRPYIHVTESTVMNTWLLRAVYDYNVKHFLYLSCGIMYQPGDEPRKESDFNEHDEIYKTYFGAGWMKVFTEKQAEFYSRLGRTKHTIIRHSNTYGPYDKYDFEHSHFFGATIRKVMDAKDGDTITVWGTGEETARDLIYVDDVVSFMDLAIQKQTTPFELCNVAAGIAFTVNEVVDSIIRASGKDLKVVHDISQPSIPTKLALDCTRAQNVFGWERQIGLKRGIQKTLDWYKDYYSEKV
jgi:GDP-L-fucose synthase